VVHMTSAATLRHSGRCPADKPASERAGEAECGPSQLSAGRGRAQCQGGGVSLSYHNSALMCIARFQVQGRKKELKQLERLAARVQDERAACVEEMLKGEKLLEVLSWKDKLSAAEKLASELYSEAEE
jgi:hypothetical protein